MLDIGSLTVDTTTEEIEKNDPLLKLTQKIVSEGGRCGMVTLLLGLLRHIVNKFGIPVTSLSSTSVGRGSKFNDRCEQLWRTWDGQDDDEEYKLTLKLQHDPQHPNYNHRLGEMTVEG